MWRVTTYVAFLRAVNLGATRKFPAASIREAARAGGFTGVETHLNTGNLRLDTRLRSRARVESVLEEAFLVDRDFEVPTVAFTPPEIHAIVEDADAFAADLDGIGVHYVSLLKHEPTQESLREVLADAERASYDGEHVRVRGRAVHLVLEERDGYHRAKLSNAWVEKRLGIATNRNLNVVRAIAEKWC
jgi:uncharacterized protein (DUF1697 family)